MRLAIQYLLISAYAILPAATFYFAVRSQKRHARRGPIVSFVLVVIGGILVGGLLFFVNVRLLEFPVKQSHAFASYSLATILEAARCIYFVIGAICAIKVIDSLLFYAACRLARVPLTASGRPRAPGIGRAALCLVIQRAVMLVLGLGFVMALLMSYRPRVRLNGTPADYSLAYQTCDFSASDGLALKGWWIGAAKGSPRLSPEQSAEWGTRTVLLCHGLGSGKERQLDLAKFLANRGFNVFVFDFRAHGESAGNFISYGDRERLDVLAAIDWIHNNYHAQSTHIFGIGMNTGAAALLAAAADPAGQAIDALVLYEPFMRFDALIDNATDDVFPSPVRWLIDRIAVPIAGLHSSSNLSSFAPGEFISQIWPRPVLIVHGRGETFIPSVQSLDVYREASQPKDQFFPSDDHIALQRRVSRLRGEANVLSEMFRLYIGSSESISDDIGVREHTLHFLRDAKSLPVL